MANLTQRLEKLLRELSRAELAENGVEHISLVDGRLYIDYLNFLQRKLPVFFPVYQIVQALSNLQQDDNTSTTIKSKIEAIFSVMDPRNAHYRNGLDCKCGLCGPKKQFEMIRLAYSRIQSKN